MPLNAFRIFKPNSEKQSEDPVQRRRAQVRRAQRTYQERKNAYARSLEDALSDSKAREAVLCQKNEQLYSFLELLEDQIPVHLIDQYRNLTSSRTPKLQPSADFTSDASFSSPNNLTSPSSFSNQTPKPLPIPKEASVFTLQIASDTSVGWFHIGDFDEHTVGMEFVLFLEKPCLGHIFGEPSAQPHLATGHCLTASSQILAISGNHETIPTPDPLPISQGLPKMVLENLLRLAPQVNTQPRGSDEDWEVTPIQAWNWLRQLSHFRQVEVSSLKRLADEMAQLAKCHGFGASIPAREFERILYECIGADTQFLS